MTQITQGRELADTDQERVKAELKKFDNRAAADILNALSDAIKLKKNGWIRPHFKITNGQLTSFQLQTDFVKDLDVKPSG